MASEENLASLKQIFDALDTDKRQFITRANLDKFQSEGFKKKTESKQKEIGEFLLHLNLKDDTTRLDFRQFCQRLEKWHSEHYELEENKENIGVTDNHQTPIKHIIGAADKRATLGKSKVNIGTPDKRTPLGTRSNIPIFTQNIGPTDNRTPARRRSAVCQMPLSNDQNDDVFAGVGLGFSTPKQDRFQTPSSVARKSLSTRKSSGFYDNDSSCLSLESNEIRQELDGLQRKADSIITDLRHIGKAVDKRNTSEVHERIAQLEHEKQDRETKLTAERIRYQKLLEKRKIDEAEMEELKKEKKSLFKQIEELRQRLDAQYAAAKRAPDHKERRKVAGMIANCRSHEKELKLQLLKIDLEFGADAGNEHKTLSESSTDESPKATAASSSSEEQKSRKGGEVQDVEVALEALTLYQVHELKHEMKQLKAQLHRFEKAEKAYAEYCKNIEHELNEK